jgi:hypothetical protein
MQSDLYEYAISAGEGTLVALGQCDGIDDAADVVDDLLPGETLAIALTDEDCETGL